MAIDVSGTGNNGSSSTSASLSLSNPNMTSSAITPGNTTTVSTNVSVKVDNAESYSLILKVDSTTLKNGSTTINAGNVVNDNTWGYKWDKDNTSTYKAPTTTGTNLTVPTLTNNSANFEGILTFGAKFSTGAEAGHYRGSGTLSLVATPKKVAFGGITTMQEMTPTICSNAEVGDIATLIDNRTYPSGVSNTYTIRKMEDGRCWTTENLRITGTIQASQSDFTSPTSITIPNSISGFTSSDQYTLKGYVSGNTGYYNWYTATAQAGTSSVTANGTNVSASICPKGWTLPTGGRNSKTTDFWLLFRNMGLTISNDSLDQTGSGTRWGTGDLTKVQGSPYNFAYTGYVSNGSIDGTDSQGHWWSRTASSSNAAYILGIYSSSVYPGTYGNYSYRYIGYAVRCVAAVPEPKTFTITYDCNAGSGYSCTMNPTTQTCTTDSDQCTTTLSSNQPTHTCANWSLRGWDTNKNASSPTYTAGSNITLDSDTTLYGIWYTSGNTCAV